MGGLQVVHRRLAMTIISCSFLFLCIGLLIGPAAASAGQTDRVLELRTPEGSIDILLHHTAAPDAIEKLCNLVAGPIFSPGIRSGREPTEGYYEGLAFDHAVPGHEIATSIRPPARAILLPTQIDASALGLDRKHLPTSGKAMDFWQFEIMPEITRLKGKPEPGSILAQWLDLWKKTGNADFLLKISEKEINEGLGYEYEAGLESLPVRRGAVTLRPFDKKNSTPGLIIYLNDRPDLDGRQMVIGKIINGLDLCDAISRHPLTPVHSEEFRPLVPTPILGTALGPDRESKVHGGNHES